MATFHGSGTGGCKGGAWRPPERQQAHRCPCLSSCLPCQIKSDLFFTPPPLLKPPTCMSISVALFTPLSPVSSLPLFSPWPLIRDWICWWNDRGRKCLGGTVGPRARARAVHSALCFSCVCIISVPALQSQSLAFSLDSHHSLSVTRAQSQHPSSLITGLERWPQTEVLLGCSSCHNDTMNISPNHRDDLTCVPGQ